VEAEDRDGAVVGAVEIQSWFPRLGVDSCVSSARWAPPASCPGCVVACQSTRTEPPLLQRAVAR
jgi:hypothetical protein